MTKVDLWDYHFLPGLEKSTNDAKILKDVVANYRFSVLERKYYLVDTKYCNFDYVVISYWDVRYYLKEQNLIRQKPEKAKELFNSPYTSLKNRFEQIFGVNKKRLIILIFAHKFALCLHLVLCIPLSKIIHWKKLIILKSNKTYSVSAYLWRWLVQRFFDYIY